MAIISLADNESDETVDSLYSEIEKDYGTGILVDGLNLITNKKKVLSVSPIIDSICGGIQEGSFVGITGNQKTGKTTLALCMAAAAQDQKNGNRQVFYIKAEGRLSTEHLKGIRGLKLDRPNFNVVQSAKGRILTSQDYLCICENILKEVEDCVLIIDAISALCDEREMNGGIGTETRGGGAKLFSQFLNNISNVVPVNNSIVIGITHLMANTSGMGQGFVEKVTRRWPYQCDYLFRSVGKETWKSGEKIIGLVTEWVCNNSPLGLPPGLKNKSYIRYGVGIDAVYEAIKTAIDVKLIKQAGAWVTCLYMQKYLDILGKKSFDAEAESKCKFNGLEKCYQFLSQNKNWYEALAKELSSTLSENPQCE